MERAHANVPGDLDEEVQSRLGDVVELDVGGKVFATTVRTLFARGENFFTGLVRHRISSSGACFASTSAGHSSADRTMRVFIDRNGRYFEPLLDYLRTGFLVVPDDVNIEALRRESNYYCIDIDDALCAIPAGLYIGKPSSESNHPTLLFIERHHLRPRHVGVTAILEGTHVLFRRSCALTNACTVHVNDGSMKLEFTLAPRDGWADGDVPRLLFCNPSSWDEPGVLKWSSPPASGAIGEFPIPLDTRFKYTSKDGQRWHVMFVETSEGGSKSILMRREGVDRNGVSSGVRVVMIRVLSEHLMLFRNASTPLGLIFISGSVIFLMEQLQMPHVHVYALKRFPAEA